MDEIKAILDRIGTDNPPTSDELDTAKTELRKLMKAEAKTAKPDLELLATLRAAYDQIETELVASGERDAELKAAVDDILKDVADEDEENGDEGGSENEGENEGADDKAGDKEPVLAGAGVTLLTLEQASARLRDRPQPPAPVEQGATGIRTLINGREHTGRALVLEDIRSEFHKATRSPGAGKNSIVRFEAIEREGWLLSDEIGKRSSQVDALVSPEAVAAAGGCCILPEPIREQTVLSSTARPIRDSLPSFGVQTTGAVTFYPPVCFPQDGAFIWTCDDDAAVDPEDPETWKQCVEFECDEPVVTTVDAIYHCMTIGNFQRFFDGERWRAVLGTLLATEARLAETHLFAKMRASVQTTHVLGDTGSVFVSFIQGLGLASEILRQDQRLADVNLRLWAPEWLREAMRADLVARRIVHVDNPVAADTLINTAIGNAGANVTWSLDLDVIDANPVSSGPLPDYPAFAHLVLAPEGYYTYLDAGSFDLGTEIRDMNLTRQNAVAAFAEEFQGLMARGCQAMALDLPVSVCQVADGCEPLS